VSSGNCRRSYFRYEDMTRDTVRSLEGIDREAVVLSRQRDCETAEQIKLGDVAKDWDAVRSDGRGKIARDQSSIDANPFWSVLRLEDICNRVQNITEYEVQGR
jgi:hypothetical protein